MIKRCVSILLVCTMLIGFWISAPINTRAAISFELYGDTVHTANGVQYIVKNSEAIVVGYTGTSKTVNIPSNLNGYQVTRIGHPRANFIQEFMPGFENVTSVTIPDSARVISTSAFAGAANLTSVDFGSGLFEVGWSAFNGCSKLKTFDIPDSVVFIGSGAFDNTAWYNNQPNGLIYLKNTLYDYKGEIPANYTLKIKDGTTSVSVHAFWGETNIVNIVAPDSLCLIGSRAFYNTTWHTNQKDGPIYLGKVLYSYKGMIPSYFAIKEGTVGIAGEAFYDGKLSFMESVSSANLKSVTIPDSVKYIGRAAFANCCNLSELNIPKSVSYIGEKAYGFHQAYKGDIVKAPAGEYPIKVVGYAGTAAEKYAKEYDIAFQETKDSIAILTSEKSFGIKTGETMELAFGFLEGETGLLDGEWRRMAVTVSDNTIVSLSDYRKGEYGYFIDIKGKKQGKTNLTITDTESGVATQIVVTVSDNFVRTYSYDIKNVKPFYPNNRWENDIATNIYNLNGIYINDYVCKKTSTGYNVSFNAYNQEYHIGAVDIYDKNGNWLGSEEIKKFTDITSLWDTGEQLVYLVNDIKTHRMITYEQSSSSKHTPISFYVPEGGYFVVSNNYFESPGTYLYNTTEIVYDAMTDFADIMGEFIGTGKVTSSEFLNLVKGKFKADPTLRKAFMDTFKKTALNELQKAQKKFLKGEINEAYSDATNIYEDVMEAIDFDWKHLMKTGAGFGEGVFKKLAGPAGVALSVCFTFSKKTSQFNQAIDIGRSADEPCATFYSHIDEGYVNPYGIVVNTNGNIDDEAVLQVFRVSDSDIVEVILDDDDPLQQHQLYNISFVKDDKLVQPNGKVTVRIPIPSGMKTSTCKVYRQEDDGGWTVLDARIEGNYLVFETDHFSYYALLGESDELTIVSEPYKLRYTTGEELDITGLALKYKGKSINDGFVCTPSVLSGYGTKTITVRYGCAVARFKVEVSNGLLGDADGDGKVSVMDATAIQFHLAKLKYLAQYQVENGDADDDGVLSVMDATHIQRFLAQLIPSL